MAEISHLSIDVIFEPSAPEQKVTFGGTDINDKGQILVPQGLGLLVFNLKTISPGGGKEALFPSNPIQWVGTDDTAIAQPAVFTVRRLSDKNTTLQVINSVLDTEVHRFYVVVQYGREFYGQDPTVITQPPGGGL